MGEYMKYQSKYLFDDYKGIKFNYLTPIATSDIRAKDSSCQWVFKCICGTEILSPPARVISGHKKSCGCMRYKTPEQSNKKMTVRPPARVSPETYIGRKNERLTVVGIKRPDIKGRLQLECLCDCGNTTFVYPYQFDNGSIKSCGCARFGHSDCHKGNTSRRTHGLTSNRFYKKWNDMIRRCYNENEPAYRYYGAVGIKVCDEWRNSPEAFIQWCEETFPNDKKFSIDRIDGSKGYSPDNCRWAAQIEQVHNLKNNRFVTINGETRCVTEWCNKFGISPGTLYKRVHKGQSFEEALADLINKKCQVDE